MIIAGNPKLKQIVKHCLNKIQELHEQGCPYDDFLVLMRIASENKKIWKFIDQYAIELKVPIIKESHKTIPNHVRFMSVHKSKGLQAKVVIFEPAIANNDSMKEKEQEERRLFHVAVMRAKEEIIMYSQKCFESKFITEIKEFIKREDLR